MVARLAPRIKAGFGVAVIINPRGAGGSGKTELVRRIMGAFGWSMNSCLRAAGVLPLYREKRTRPIGYALKHPDTGAPLMVLGHYEATSGGCDTFRKQDGGIDEVFRLAGAYASSGYKVLLEGLCLSTDCTRSLTLAQEHRLHVLRLSTPPAQCATNLVRRRRTGARARAAFASQALTLGGEIDRACERLRSCAEVEFVGFDEAIGRTKTLLGFDEVQVTGSSVAPDRPQRR